MRDFKILFIAFLCLTPFSVHAEMTTLSLDQAVKMAFLQHPDLSLERARSAESRALKDSSPGLPPPTLFGTVMGSNGPLNSNGRMENSFGLSQTVPFPTKLKAESKVRQLESSSAETRIKAEELKIAAQVKSDFFEVFGAREKQNFLKEKQSVLAEHNRRVRATTLSDRIVQAHQIWIQTELDLIENEMISAREEEKIAEGRLNLAMGMDPTVLVPELLVPKKSPAPVFSRAPLIKHPKLQALEFSRSAALASTEQARSLWLPDFNLSYRNAHRFDGVMPNYSELTVGVTLPFLFFWQPHAQVSAANARLQMAEAEIQKMQNDLNQEQLEAQAHAESFYAQLLNYENKILPQAEKRMRIAHGLVPSDMESLNEHRDAMVSVITLKLSALKLRVDYEKAVAVLESLTVNEEGNSHQ